MNKPKLQIARSLFLVVLSSFSTVTLKAQQYFENPLTIKGQDGLVLQHISDVAKDKRGFIWIGGVDGLLRYDGQFFKEFYHDITDSTSILPGRISSLLYDEDKEELWIGHWGGGGGISVLNLKTEKARIYPYDPLRPKVIPADDIYWFCKDAFGQIWAGTREDGLIKYDEANDNFEAFAYRLTSQQQDFQYTSYNRFESYSQDISNDSLIWIGTGAGLLRFNVITHSFQHHALQNAPSSHYGIRDVHYHSDGQIYLGLWGAGLFRFDPASKQFSPCLWDAFGGKVGESSHILQKIMAKSEDRLWITTDWGLLEYDIPTEQIIKSWNNDKNKDKLYGAYVMDDLGRIFVWDRNVLVIYDPLRQQIETYDLPDLVPPYPYIFRRFVEDESTDYIWAACQLAEGLYRLDPNTGHWRIFRPEPKDFDSDRRFEGWDIIRTQQGELLLLEKEKIYIFSEKEQRIVPYGLQPNAPNANYRRMIQDRKGNLWIGTYYEGLYKINPTEKTIEHFYRELIHPDFKDTGALWDLQEDRNGNIWIRGRGCHVYDVRKDTFYNFPYLFPSTKKPTHIESIGLDGAGNAWVLGHDQVIGITDANHPESGFRSFLTKNNGLQLFKPRFMSTDEKGHVWIVNKDMERIDLETNSSTYFPHHYFYDKHMWGIDHLSRGRMVLGFKGTIGIFHSDSLKTDPKPPNPYVSSFKVFDQERFTDLPLYRTKDIYLDAKENFFSFTISAINPSLMPGVTYSYQMVGVDPDWVNPGDRRYIAYTDLSPGSYVFRLKAANHMGVECTEPYLLNVHIAAPWYRTWLAYLVYLIFLTTSLYQIFRFSARRRKLRLTLARQEEKAAQLKELDTMKSLFYTNITHEFRTPLTIIQGLADQIGQQGGDKIREKVGLIKSNGGKLLRLINQLLDLSKLEAGKMEISYIQADLIRYLRYWVQSFHSLATDRGIQLTFDSREDQLLMDFDPNQMQTIISNLVSNALNFTPAKGKVEVVAHKFTEQDQQFLQIEVLDNGNGIPEADLPHLFDRFYQVDASITRRGEGTGIGLALVQELVQLLEGSVTVKSQIGKGSCFSIRLPIKQEAVRESFEFLGERKVEESIINNKQIDFDPQPSSLEEAPTLLLVEDNPDVIYYLKSCLANRYQILEASNGKEGLQKALGRQPDLVISDVMMPEMDGYTLCRTLKQTPATEHIPVLLLTAKATDTDRKEGYSYGADAYLMKPFDPEELSIRIKQLLQLRKTLQKKYWKAARIRRLEDLEVAAGHRPFTERLDECIFQNLSDPKFKVDQLASAMFMSRTALFKAMKKAVKVSPTEYLNRARLDLADQLLVETNMTIAAIAQKTGFSSDSYFSKKYEAAYGRKPSERRQKLA